MPNSDLDFSSFTVPPCAFFDIVSDFTPEVKFRNVIAEYTSTYTYGFNGKQKDDEVSGEGDSYDYGLREYDSRIGKFKSIDPLTKKYPELTPYQFASDSPIKNVDLDGAEGTDAKGGNDSEDDKPKEVKSKPTLELSVGNNFAAGSSDNGSPLMISNNGVKNYQTPILNPFSFHSTGPDKNDLTEGNHVIGLTLKFPYSPIQFGFLGYKEKKVDDANNFGFEASGPLLLTVSYNKKVYDNHADVHDSFKVGFSIGGGEGMVVGAPRLNGTLYPGGIFGSGYRNIGRAAALIIRVDFTFCDRITLGVMASGTHYDISPFQDAPQGSRGGESHDTFAVKALIGINLAR
jgi:RHS repeat-associated protein